MDAGNLFYEKIKDLRARVRQLKTAHVKTATTISTASKAASVNFSLKLDTLSLEVFSTKRAILTLTTSDDSEMLTACYLQGETPTSINGRQVEILRLQPQEGVARYGIAVTAGNESDFNTLNAGGSVNLTYTIEAIGTSDFNLSVEYKDIDGGTL